jgi:DNA mismatch endonuclease (patch repair protein)
MPTGIYKRKNKDYRKGKTYEQIYGEKRAKKIREKKKYKYTKEMLTKRTESRRKNGWNRFPERTKSLQSKARLKQILPAEDTKIEIKMQKALENNKIIFEKHKPLLNKYRVDLFVQPNIIIECDGCYWHNCLMHFPEYHKKNREKDNAKTKELEENGYIVLRFWGHEINNDISLCLEHIKKTILLR